MKFELGDTVYFLRNYKVVSGTVIARQFSDKIETYNLYTDGPQNEWLRKFGGFSESYIVNWNRENLILDSEYLFASKEALIESL